MPSFQDLDVWKKSHELTLDIYRLTSEFPKDEKYRLGDQLRRSASSIPANIAEGKGRSSQKEFLRFLDIARGSVEETKYHLLLAKDLSYIPENDYNKFAETYGTVGKMLNGLINKINKEIGTGS